MGIKKRLSIGILMISLIIGIIQVPVLAADTNTGNKDNETIIYEFLRGELGLNVAASCGVLANIKEESNFSPTAYNGNDTGGTISYGICQWNNGSGSGNRYGALLEWCEANGYAYNSLEGQLQFMKYELQEGRNYRYFRYTRLRDEIENSAEGAYEASKIWSTYYEGCASIYHEPRAKSAQETYWPKYKGELLKIESQPQNVTVENGERARVEFVASGADISYQWYYKNLGANKFSLTNSFKGNAYYIDMNETRDGRQVYCVLTDKYGNQMQTEVVSLEIKKELNIIKEPESVKVQPGEKATVEVQAVGNRLTYEWYYKDAGESEFKYTSTFQGPTYSVKMTDARDGRQVYCVVTDERGNGIETDTVTLDMMQPLELIKDLEGVKVANGERAKVTVEATGEGLTYEWYYKNAGASKFSRTTSFKGASYYIDMTAKRDGREVYCIITDEYGYSLQTETVKLEMQKPVKITTQPVSVTVKKGEIAKVTVKAEGDGLTYKWYYKNAKASKFSYTTSFKKENYYVEMSKTRSGRQVYCVITDAYGNSVTTETVTLKMK